MDGASLSLQQIVGDFSDEADTSDEELLQRVLELYFQSDGKRSESDTDAFSIVLEQTAYKVGLEKRAELSNQLALTKGAPTRLMRRLAFDNIIVARPVLQYSDRLSNSDLVTLASKLSQDHLHAIAHRLKLTSPVTDVLVDRGESPALVTLTHNSGAEFSPDGLVRLEKRAETDPDLSFALGLRPDLNPGLFSRFSNFINGQLLGEIGLGKLGTNGEAAPVEKTAPPEDLSESGAKKTDGDSDVPASEENGNEPNTNSSGQEGDLVWTGPVHERSLAEIAREGRLDESVCCLARLTKLAPNLARHCLLVADVSALMVLCKANNFASGTFSALMSLRDANTSASAIDTVSMLKRYDAMKAHTARRIIDYANAKRDD